MQMVDVARTMVTALVLPIAFVLAKILNSVFHALIRRPRSLSGICKTHKIAVVFGASSGIGKEFAIALSSRGFDVIAVARRETQLLALKSEIQQKSGKCTIICCDASHDDQIDNVFKQIDAAELGIAVYASGVCNKIPNYLEDLDNAEIEQAIAVNVSGMVRFSANASRILKRNKKGLICLFSSETGLYPSPLMTVYGATKAFTANFAVALNEECRKSGVQVIAAAPFWVASEMTMTSRTSWRMAGAREFVERLLAGRFRDVVINPWWSHKLLAVIMGSRFGPRIQHRGMIVMREKVIRKLKRMDDEQIKEAVEEIPSKQEECQ